MPSVSIPPFLTLPPGVSPRRVAADGTSLAVLDNSDLVDQPLGSALLIPGFTGSKEDYIALFEPLALRRVRAVALDLTGQYESLLPEGGHADLARFAADVWHVACDLPRPLVVVGHSFGGLVAREAVLSDPLAVDGLVLIASGPAAIPGDQQAILQQFVQVMDAHGLAAVWQGKQAMDAAAGVSAPTGEVAEFLTGRFLANAPASLHAMITELCAADDDTEALAAVTPPAAVVIGAQDDVWPIAEQRRMAAALRATVVELDGVGHSPAVEAPGAVADAVAELLGSSDAVAD